MIQQAMNVMQATRPILPRPEINQQVMSVIPMSKLDFSSNFAVGRGFGMHCGEMPTLFSKMYDQEYLKCSFTDLTANFQLLEVEKMTQMLPSSSNFRYIQRKQYDKINLSSNKFPSVGLGSPVLSFIDSIPWLSPSLSFQLIEVYENSCLFLFKN